MSEETQKPATYMWFRKNVAFKFTFFYHDPYKARMMITGYEKDGMDGPINKDTAINIALNIEEAAELAHGIMVGRKVSLVHDLSKFNKDMKQMKSLNLDEFKGNYWLSLKYSDELKRTICPSLGEALVLKRAVDIFIEKTLFGW